MARTRRRVGYGMSNREFALGAANLGIRLGGMMSDIEERKAAGIKNRQAAELYESENEPISIEPEDDPVIARAYKNLGKDWVDSRIIDRARADITKDPMTGKRMIKRGKYREFTEDFFSDPETVADLNARKFSRSFNAVRAIPDFSNERIRAEHMKKAEEARGRGMEGPGVSEAGATDLMNKMSQLRSSHKQNLNEALGKVRMLKGPAKEKLMSSIARVSAFKGMTIEDYKRSVIEGANRGVISETDAPLFINYFNRAKLATETEKVAAAKRNADIQGSILEAERASFEARGIKGKTPVYSEEELKRLPRYAKGLIKKGQKPPYVKGKRVQFTGPEGSKQEGTFQGMSKEGEPQFTNVRKVKEKGGKGRAGDRRQRANAVRSALKDIVARIPKDEMTDSDASKVFQDSLAGSRKYYKTEQDPNAIAMLAFREAIEKLPKEEKEKAWYTSLWERLFGGNEETEEEPPATPETELPGAEVSPASELNSLWRK